MDEEGFLYLTDRKKDMIISGGENIASSEVERVVYELPQVQEAAVIGVADDRWGERPVAVVVLKARRSARRYETLSRALPRQARRLQGAQRADRAHRAAAQPLRQDPQARPARGDRRSERTAEHSDMAQPTIKVYSDYKSPYAYLAKDLIYELERDTGARLDWLPYTLDIPAYLGSAKVDADGTVLEETRNAHQWRRVKYSYMDCRREANRRGLTIRGPRKIFDSSLANIGMLYAQGHGVFRAYHDRVFERFWRRELDIESPAALAALLSECGADGAGFAAFAESEGRRHLVNIRAEAEAAGRVRRPELPARGRRPLLGPRAPAPHPRAPRRGAVGRSGKARRQLLQEHAWGGSAALPPSRGAQQRPAHRHLLAPDGRGGYLPGCRELPHQRRDDRESSTPCA